MGRMILNGTVYGAGSKVEANPDETATDELKKIDIDGTIYNIAEGTINVYGAFIDTSKILLPETRISGNGSYTAQEDCFITLLYYLGNWATNVALDNENIISANNMTPNCWNYVIFPVKKEQELTYNLGYNGWLKIYGVKGGSNPISAPIIYSEEEREVGVWIDNKPLYARTLKKDGTFTSNTSIPIPNYDTFENVFIADAWATDTGNNKLTMPYVYPTSLNYARGCYINHSNKTVEMTVGSSASVVNPRITIYYTKTTDVAGSGSYNTLGVPNVHYSTNEQVIGTWIDGKTLYQKTIEQITNTRDNTVITISGITSVMDVKAHELIGWYEENSVYYPCFAFSYPFNAFDALKVDRIYGNNNPYNVKILLTIKYTKTTD